MDEFVVGIIGAITTFISGFSSWFFTRRAYKAEVSNKEINNFDAAIGAYKKMYEDMIEDLKAQNSDLKEEVESLKKELSENRKQIITLTNFVLANALQKGDDITKYEDLRNIIK